MRVKLIQITQNPIEVMWTAARTCYSEKSPIEMWETRYPENIDLLDGYDNGEKEEIVNKHWNLVKKVLDSGHQSIAEHVYFTFAIESISRACSHQLVRHRAGIVFSQQSQRYVEIKENYKELCDIPESAAATAGVTDKYFVSCEDGMSGIKYAELNTLKEYRRLIEKENMKAEDARMILPNATKTNITMSLNYRELIHICNLRLCNRAQKEIRDLFALIKKEVEQFEPKLATYLVPSCEVYGVCFEGKCCGRKPSIKELKTTYKVAKNDMDDVLSETDWDILMDSIKNPKVNDNLRRLMEMPSELE